MVDEEKFICIRGFEVGKCNIIKKLDIIYIQKVVINTNRMQGSRLLIIVNDARFPVDIPIDIFNLCFEPYLNNGKG